MTDIPTPRDLKVLRIEARNACKPNELNMSLFTTSSSRDPQGAIASIVERGIRNNTHLVGYVYDGLNAKGAMEVFRAFKRKEWAVSITGSQHKTPNRVSVMWPIDWEG